MSAKPPTVGQQIRQSESPRAMGARGKPSKTYTSLRAPGGDVRKLTRFRERVRMMIEEWGTFVYYPEEDRFEEITSIQDGRFSPTGKPRFIPSLTVFGREVYETRDPVWKLFLMGHPRAVVEVSAEFKPPSEGGLLDIDAFAVTREEKVR